MLLPKSVPTTLPGPTSTNFPTVPTQSTAKTNNILSELMVIANKVTSGKEYDWKLVAQQLGLTQVEGMKLKKYCATNDPTKPAATNDTNHAAASNDTTQPAAAA
ncbi:heme-binding domain protein [Sesbania bispinosa]|nr:heme-binding domain protein [Sesbania bispinosa]